MSAPAPTPSGMDLMMKSDRTIGEVLAELKAEHNRLKTENQALRKALEQVAELEGDCEQQKFKLTRFQASQIARFALHTKG